MENEIPLWFYSYTIHNQIEEKQQKMFESGQGYVFTDDDRAVMAREIVQNTIDRNGVSNELGNLILAQYYNDFIRDL